MTRRNARPLIALAAAYALALQAVFAGLVLGARSGEAALLAAGGLCLTGHSQDDGNPIDRMPCCSLAACCPAALDTPVIPCGFPAPPAPKGERAALDPVSATVVAFLSHSRHQPRAPPAA